MVGDDDFGVRMKVEKIDAAGRLKLVAVLLDDSSLVSCDLM